MNAGQNFKLDVLLNEYRLKNPTKLYRISKKLNLIQRKSGKRWETLCIHERSKKTCVLCEGSATCVHKKQRRQCRECGGWSFCEHNIERSRCKQCKGGSICIHNRSRTVCKECRGGGICEHNKRRSDCKDCDGVNICITCKDRKKKKGNFCIRCHPEYIPTKAGHLKYHVILLIRWNMKWEYRFNIFIIIL